MKSVIKAISFLHKGERIIVNANSRGRFKVPVSEVVEGRLKTRIKALTASQVVNHEIIRNCDPTLYITDGDRQRVYPAGDSSYLPAHIDGIIQKHDNANSYDPIRRKPKTPKVIIPKATYNQASLDMYGWYPGYDDGTAD